MKLNRRDFLRGLGATAAALLLPRGLRDKAEAERLVTPDHGGLLVLPEQRVALIDNLGLHKPMWAGTNLAGEHKVYVSDLLKFRDAMVRTTGREIWVSDELLADGGDGASHWIEAQTRACWYVNGENPAARDLPGYGLTPDTPMSTIAYALRASDDRPATITLWGCAPMEARPTIVGEIDTSVINPEWEWVAKGEA